MYRGHKVNELDRFKSKLLFKERKFTRETLENTIVTLDDIFSASDTQVSVYIFRKGKMYTDY